MNEEALKRTWLAHITDAASLGPSAIKELLLLSSTDRAHVSSVDVVGLGDDAYKVKIGYRHRPCPTVEVRYVEIGVRRHLKRDRPYADFEAAIERRQREMPDHLAGRKHNVDQFMYDKILDLVRRVTGYEGLMYGDLWVHSCKTLDEAKGAAVRGEGAHEGMVCFGYLTRAGEIAMQRFQITQFGPDAEPVYATGDCCGRPVQSGVGGAEAPGDGGVLRG